MSGSIKKLIPVAIMGLALVACSLEANAQAFNPPGETAVQQPPNAHQPVTQPLSTPQIAPPALNTASRARVIPPQFEPQQPASSQTQAVVPESYNHPDARSADLPADASNPAVAAIDGANANGPLVATAEGTSMYDTVINAFTGDRHAMKELLITYGPIFLLIIVVLIVGYMVASYVGRMTGSFVSKKVDLTLGRFLNKAVRNGIMLIILAVALKRFGVDITAFAVAIGALGFAVGMALQGTLGNIAAGIMLLIFRPFKVDDYIIVAGTEGTVEEIDLFTTRLNTLDNRHVIVPNGEIFGNTLENFSRNPVRRVDVNVGAEYSADLDTTRRILEEAASNIPGAVAEPAPQVYLVELADSSVNWQLRVWCHPTAYWNVREELTESAKKSMDANGIGIPFPQLDVNFVGKLLARAA